MGKKESSRSLRYRLNHGALRPRETTSKQINSGGTKKETPVFTSQPPKMINQPEVQSGFESQPKHAQLTPAEKENIRRNRKALLLCSPSNCPEVDSNTCSCRVFDHEVYKSRFGYSDPEIFDERLNPHHRRSEYCFCVGGCKLCLSFQALCCCCCLQSCGRCQVLGCGEWASYHCTGQKCVDCTCRLTHSLFCDVANRCMT